MKHCPPSRNRRHIILWMLATLLLCRLAGADEAAFRRIEIQEPFRTLLLASPDFMESSGLREFRGEDEKRHLV